MPSVLHVELRVREGEEQALLGTYCARFRPALSRQQGFRAARLLRPVAAAAHRLVIEFASEELRQRWVASELHQQVWPEIAGHCESSTPVLFEELEG